MLDLGRLEDADELLAILDAELPGRLPPLMRAERELVRARLAAIRSASRSQISLSAPVSADRRGRLRVERAADLPVMAERIDHATESPAVGFFHRHDLARAGREPMRACSSASIGVASPK